MSRTLQTRAAGVGEGQRRFSWPPGAGAATETADISVCSCMSACPLDGTVNRRQGYSPEDKNLRGQRVNAGNMTGSEARMPFKVCRMDRMERVDVWTRVSRVYRPSQIPQVGTGLSTAVLPGPCGLDAWQLAAWCHSAALCQRPDDGAGRLHGCCILTGDAR